MTTTTASLFAAADAALISLPRSVTLLRQAQGRAQQHLAALTAPPHHLTARDDLTESAVEALIAGEPVPDVDPVLDAERESRAFEHRLEVARNAALTLDRNLATSIAAASDEIIVDALRPTFETLVAQLQGAYTLLEPFETAGRGALALASAKVRTAASLVDKGTHDYGLIRTAAAEVRATQPPPEYDVDGEFVAFTDVHVVWPRERRTNFGSVPPPWEQAPDVLAWQLRHLTPWLPTTAEQDSEWLEVYGEALKAQQVLAEQQQAMRSTFGPN